MDKNKYRHKLFQGSFKVADINIEQAATIAMGEAGLFLDNLPEKGWEIISSTFEITYGPREDSFKTNVTCIVKAVCKKQVPELTSEIPLN